VGAVWGLRDPLAVAPESLLAASKLKGEAVQGVWEPYQALAPPILVRRAARLLEAPPSVTLRMAGGVLQAAGTAPRAWRLQARERVPFLAGLAGYDDTALVDAGVERLFQLADSLEQQAVFFEGGGAALVPGQGDALAAQAALVQTLIETGTAAGRTVRLRIVGHASTEGTEERNLSVSQARAALVRQALARRGVPPEGMDAVGTGTAELPHAERTEADRALNRRISYHVRFEEAPQ
jgi:outer membrane protein OmpA-like peptidoglycan-associated protein